MGVSFIQAHMCLQIPSLIPVLLFKLGKEKNPGQAHAMLNCLPNLGTHKVLSTAGPHCPRYLHSFIILKILKTLCAVCAEDSLSDLWEYAGSSFQMILTINIHNMCCNVPALCPHGAADSPHAGQRPQAQSSGNAPHDCSLEETGLH